ncbi:CMGC/CDK/CDK7 protein kinase [Blastocladiella britannica]|nr:CMGC/CDK/CDK7 protein kinase [Blastocladiella britannica]
METEAEKKSQRYRLVKMVGSGAYAKVYRGVDVVNNRIVAVKQIRVGLMMQSEMGMDLSAIRELKVLQELHHPNIVDLIDVYRKGMNLNLVLEYLETDLEKIIRDPALTFQEADIKSWMLMMLRGIAWCHRNWVLHRDLKPNNLLIARDGQLKLADFGLARDYGQDPCISRPMSPNVITSWYRPPELLLNARQYAFAVDMWSAGCIFAELLNRAPFLPGKSDMEQLVLIFHVLGTPTDDTWPGFSDLARGMEFKHEPGRPIASCFQVPPSPSALALVSLLLKQCPSHRPSAEDALRMAFFSDQPYPTPPERLPKPAVAKTKAKSQVMVGNTGKGEEVLLTKPAKLNFASKVQ